MSELIIAVTPNGVREVSAHVKTVADCNKIGRLNAGIALPLSLVDKAARDIMGAPAEPCAEGQQYIWIDRGGDECDLKFEQLPLRVAPTVHPLEHLGMIPTWFVTAMRQGFSEHPHQRHLWSNADHLAHGRDQYNKSR